MYQNKPNFLTVTYTSYSLKIVFLTLLVLHLNYNSLVNIRVEQNYWTLYLPMWHSSHSENWISQLVLDRDKGNIFFFLQKIQTIVENNNIWVNSMYAYKDWWWWQSVDKNFHNTKTISNLTRQIYIYVYIRIRTGQIYAHLHMHISRNVSIVIPYLFWSFYFSVCFLSKQTKKIENCSADCLKSYLYVTRTPETFVTRATSSRSDFRKFTLYFIRICIGSVFHGEKSKTEITCIHELIGRRENKKVFSKTSITVIFHRESCKKSSLQFAWKYCCLCFIPLIFVFSNCPNMLVYIILSRVIKLSSRKY